MMYPKFAITLALVAAAGHVTADDSSNPTDINAIASLLSADFSDEITQISSLWTDTDFMSSLSSILSDNTDLWASIQATIDAAVGTPTDDGSDADIGNAVDISNSADSGDSADAGGDMNMNMSSDSGNGDNAVVINSVSDNANDSGDSGNPGDSVDTDSDDSGDSVDTDSDDSDNSGSSNPGSSQSNNANNVKPIAGALFASAIVCVAALF
ncbi:hypothetical protein GGI24_001110 [Coemansia furcata]|nr:hypothetical protein GGI24_001110 [Coemansia furcata]